MIKGLCPNGIGYVSTSFSYLFSEQNNFDYPRSAFMVGSTMLEYS